MRQKQILKDFFYKRYTKKSKFKQIFIKRRLLGFKLCKKRWEIYIH